jgi:teichuronic acid biosynthesis glycosyltransferase TuaG
LEKSANRVASASATCEVSVPPEFVRGLVSVIMAAFNSTETLAESVQSVLSQTYRNWELLIVDDASTDDTLSIARRFEGQDERIRVIPLDQNSGVANARNVGIRNARGQFLAFLDSDDIWLPEKLSIQIDFMDQTGAGFSFTRYRKLKADGSLGREITIPDTVNYEQLLKGNVIGCLTVVIDRKFIPYFQMPRIGHEDYVTWLQILKQGNTAFGIQKELARYRLSGSSVSGNKQKSARWTWNIYRQVEKLPLSKAVWCFILYSLRSVPSLIGI